MSDVVVVADVRPRFVVEVGEIESIEEVRGVVICESPSWSFRFAFDLLSDAEAAARRLAEELEHVRIVDREPRAAVPVGVPDGAEGCSECMPGEGLLPSARVVLDGCSCGNIPVSEIRARGEAGPDRGLLVWAWGVTGLRPLERLLLVAMVFASGGGRMVYSTEATFAALLEVSVLKLRGVVGALLEKGLVERVDGGLALLTGGGGRG